MATKEEKFRVSPRRPVSLVYPKPNKNKVTTQFQEGYKGTVGEKNSMDSMTRPDLALSIKQLLVNHTRNIASNIGIYDPKYYEDVELPVIQDLNDLVDNRKLLEDKLKIVKNEIEELRETKRKQEVSKAREIAKDLEKAPEMPEKAKSA